MFSLFEIPWDGMKLRELYQIGQPMGLLPDNNRHGSETPRWSESKSKAAYGSSRRSPEIGRRLRTTCVPWLVRRLPANRSEHRCRRGSSR